LEAFQKLVRSFFDLVGGLHRSRISARREGGEDDMERGGGGAIKLTISERTSSGRKGRGGAILGRREDDERMTEGFERGERRRKVREQCWRSVEREERKEGGSSLKSELAFSS